MLKEGFNLPFQTRPNLTGSPTIISCYVNPHRNLYLIRGITSACEQKCSRVGQKSRIPMVLKPTIFGPKTKQLVEAYTRSQQSQKFLKAEKFKMETPEKIRISLQTGELVRSIDHNDAYFHIPIQSQSRKYLRLHVQGQTYQFKGLPFGLSTEAMEWPKRSNGWLYRRV